MLEIFDLIETAYMVIIVGCLGSLQYFLTDIFPNLLKLRKQSEKVLQLVWYPYSLGS
jgi:hypothetical protein